MKVSAVVISHGHASELEQSLPALAPQVDELVVIANVPGSLPEDLPEGVLVVENDTPLSFAANANLGALLMARGLPYDSDEGRAYSAARSSASSGSPRTT